MMSLGAPLSAVLLLAAAPAAAWEARVEANGLRTATVAGEASVEGRSVPATLELRCMPGERGMLEWRMAIEGASMLDFDFDRFEGPGAPAAEERLATLSLAGGLLRPRIPPVSMAGWYDGDDRFLLAFVAPATAGGEGALLADSIGPHSEALLWTVAQAPGAAIRLEARFPLAAAAPAVRGTMAGCGPAPPLDDALRDAWRGRNPHSIDWFAQRAVAWRLLGLLGERHGAVLARMAAAEPIGTDGETVYVLAPARDSPRDGTAILLRGDGVEVVLVDAGAVERLVAGRSAIPLPDAVRAFVAQRSAPAGR
jgi:hypothetical protein